MKRRTFLKMGGKPGKQPNILLIRTDQQIADG